MKLAVQLPFVAIPEVFRVLAMIIRRKMLPDNNRIRVKLDALMASFFCEFNWSTQHSMLNKKKDY